MFTTAYRDQVRDHVLKLADSDERVVAAAVVGSMAHSEGDRWSDLDLTFSVGDAWSIRDVLEDWTKDLVEAFEAVHLFDVVSGTSLYRVFLLPGCLQVDISFTPASSFGAMGPNFRLLFGEAVTKPQPVPQPANELFGYAVHHLLRARFCIERGRYWLAEYWISSARDYALSLACQRRGLPTYYGRGFDNLPHEVLDCFRNTFVQSLEPTELQRALNEVIAGLLTESGELASQIQPHLHELTTIWHSQP